MKRVFRFAWRALPFFVLAAVLLAVFLLPRGGQVRGEEVRIVRVWNVDTFEGGKGSRTSFLKRAALLAERGREGVRYLVTSVTQEGALAALAEGEMPDVLSFGGGLSAFGAYALPLGESFADGDRALPWCRGKYFLFSLTDDFSASGDTAISVGGSNLSVAAAYFSEIRGTETQSLTAYVDFLGGKFRYLLGTQRDRCRFASRGAAVYEKELPAYCDLYQYAAVLSEQSYDDALFFIDILRSETVQSMLSDIGMFPVAGAEGYTMEAFADEEHISAFVQALRMGESVKFLRNFLKTV